MSSNIWNSPNSTTLRSQIQSKNTGVSIQPPIARPGMTPQLHQQLNVGDWYTCSSCNIKHKRKGLEPYSGICARCSSRQGRNLSNITDPGFRPLVFGPEVDYNYDEEYNIVSTRPTSFRKPTSQYYTDRFEYPDPVMLDLCRQCYNEENVDQLVRNKGICGICSRLNKLR